MTKTDETRCACATVTTAQAGGCCATAEPTEGTCRCGPSCPCGEACKCGVDCACTARGAR